MAGPPNSIQRIPTRISAKPMTSSTDLGTTSRRGARRKVVAGACSMISSLVCIAARRSLDAGGDLVEAAAQLFELGDGLLRRVAGKAAERRHERGDALPQGVGLALRFALVEEAVEVRADAPLHLVNARRQLADQPRKGDVLQRSEPRRLLFALFCRAVAQLV